MEQYKVVVKYPARSTLTDDIKAKVRGIAALSGAYQDDQTAVWEMSDNVLMLIVEQVIAMKSEKNLEEMLNEMIDKRVRRLLASFGDSK